MRARDSVPVSRGKDEKGEAAAKREGKEGIRESRNEKPRFSGGSLAQKLTPDLPTLSPAGEGGEGYVSGRGLFGRPVYVR